LTENNGYLKNQNIGILILRIAMGTMMILHGLMKIAGGIEFIQKLGGLPPFVPNNSTLHLILGFLVVIIEIAGGIGILTGYQFRIACVLLILVLLSGFTYHLGSVKDFSSLMRNTWPLEIAFVFIALYFIGPGKKSIVKNRQL
jgi:putative oxidoreductase